MLKITPEVYAIIVEAYEAARVATDKMIAENPNVWYPCGFAWVRIRPARGAIVTALKEKGLGRTDDYEGGFVIYNPSDNNTQWMDAKVAGARAFAEVFRKHGVKCNAESRID